MNFSGFCVQSEVKFLALGRFDKDVADFIPLKVCADFDQSYVVVQLHL